MEIDKEKLKATVLVAKQTFQMMGIPCPISEDIEIDVEYELIQLKKSKLPARQRHFIQNFMDDVVIPKIQDLQVEPQPSSDHKTNESESA